MKISHHHHLTNQWSVHVMLAKTICTMKEKGITQKIRLLTIGLMTSQVLDPREILRTLRTLESIRRRRFGCPGKRTYFRDTRRCTACNWALSCIRIYRIIEQRLIVAICNRIGIHAKPKYIYIASPEFSEPRQVINQTYDRSCRFDCQAKVDGGREKGGCCTKWRRMSGPGGQGTKILENAGNFSQLKDYVLGKYRYPKWTNRALSPARAQVLCPGPNCPELWAVKLGTPYSSYCSSEVPLQKQSSSRLDHQVEAWKACDFVTEVRSGAKLKAMLTL